MNLNRIKNIAAILNNHPLFSAQSINPRPKISSFGFYVLVLAVLILMMTVILEPKLHSLTLLAVLTEGCLLLFIIFLYHKQYSELKAISEEKAAALGEIETRMAAIEAAADGIGIINPNGQLIYFNDALQKIYAIPEAHIAQYIGENWLKLLSDQGQRLTVEEVIPQLQEKGFWSGVSPLVRKDGSIIQAELTLTRLDDGSMIGTARDISDKLRAQKEKRILEQQFYQAQKMEAVGRLAGGIAHDFNNILAAIAGYGEFLSEDLDPQSKEKSFADKILKATNQAKELVDQMLTFSRQRQSNKEPMNLVHTIWESLSMIKASFPKSIEVVTDFEIDKCFINGNPTQISQMIMNLCVNAQDAMEENQGKLLLELEECDANSLSVHEIVRNDLSEADENIPMHLRDVSSSRTMLYMGIISNHHRYVCLRVSDNGCGMSRIIMERIFEPFFTTKSVDKGTGLGLATVHGVISSHQGALIIDSEVGKGTSFTCFFPLIDEKNNAITENPDAHGIVGSAHILLVEDQEEVLLMMREALERLGCTVDYSENGKEALMKIKDSKNKYDLVITDHNMPIMSGFELIQQVSTFNPDLPFIMVSGYSAERLDEMIKGHKSIHATLRKPFGKTVLHEKIIQVLAQRI